ncbi:ATP synthase F0 subcomplex A subunit [Caldanaerobius fijiensis DSM 17918]|uniref:ATP synthase subunit a n=1 Tax=Caldanaerobius fijiensis DSM 17918 TaxID=1121256 RepID=A0A1M4XYV3_9THEO|nr:F0F1 ATP synthase subunit A [Caldanaerobius fijiensis]SHE98526.1 ATP synthase F0 subcomplex A subunit [Caldanaerobius fijiensis DSM 17918]
MDVGPKVVFTIPLFKGIPVTDTVVVTWIIMAILIVLMILLTRRFEEVPRGAQNVLEIIVESINNLTRQLIGEKWRSFAPYFGTVAIFLVFANIIGVIGFKPPTRDISLTAALAVMTMAIYIGAYIKYKGFKNWLVSFVKPIPLLGILDLFTRPLSLTVRLYGNILAGVIIMELIYRVIPIVIPAALSLYFDFFDGFIQMLIFVFLSMLYVSEAVNEHEI